MARPSEYSPEIAALICERIAAGESVRQICRDEEMPAQSQIYVWLQVHAEFQEQYARAREAQTEYLADEILEIADDGTNDWIDREQESGRIIEVPDHEHISRSKLRVDARKWLLSKLAPKKYGDKLTVGGDKDNPIHTINEVRETIVDPGNSGPEGSQAPTGTGQV